MGAVIKLAFEEIGMNKLVALHDKANPASGRVMQNLNDFFLMRNLCKLDNMKKAV